MHFFDKASRYRFFSRVNGKKSWLNYFTQRKRGREVLMWDFSWVCNQLIKDKSNLLNLCVPVGDPGYHRTAQAEQRNVQQGLQQLLLQGGRPHPGLTGQSPAPSISCFEQPVSCVLFGDSWQASGSSHELRVLMFNCPRAALHLWLWPCRRCKSHK